MAEYGIRRSLSGPIARARRAEKLVALAILLLLLTIATAGVTSVLISPDWGSLWRGLLLGLLVGWVLAIFRLSAWRAALIAIAVGSIYALLAAGGLSTRVSSVVVEFALTAGRIVATRTSSEVDLTLLVDLLQDLSTSVGVLVERVWVWTVDLTSGEPNFDPVAAALVWNMLVWVVASWAGWVVEARGDALLAASPAILLSVASLSYGRRPSAAIYLMLGLTLVLMATVQHDRREQAWDQAGVAYPARKGRQIGNTALIVTTGLVLLSAVVSSLSFQGLIETVSGQRSLAAPPQVDLAKSLGIITGSTAPPDVFEAVRRPGLPRDLLIGSGPELSKRIVMTVEVENLPPISPPGQSLPLYWRSFTYDVYTGYGWRTSETEQITYEANQPLYAVQNLDHAVVQQTIRSVEGGGGAIYAVGHPVMVNLQSQAAWRSSEDLFGIWIDYPNSYAVRSLIPLADEQTLRAAGQRYPDWVRQRFLALPPDVPGRVKELAIDLTAAEPTPYDRARSIERYLRRFTYTLDVPRPPLDRDVVDFFLVDLQRGYCDYYASAMVVLARAAGVPARLAVGYASGTYNLKSKRFVVAESDAHSWPEVYFPNVGWVPFEPTAARPAFGITERREPEAVQPSPTAVERPTTDRPRFTRWGWLLSVGLVGLTGALGGVWAAVDGIRLRRLSEPAAAAEIYRRMRRYSASLAVAVESGDTPYELAEALSAQLRRLTHHRIGEDLGLRMSREVQEITTGIVYSNYRPFRSADAQDSDLLERWRVLRWQLRLMWLLKSWRSLQGRFKGRLAGVTLNDMLKPSKKSSPDGI